MSALAPIEITSREELDRLWTLATPAQMIGIDFGCRVVSTPRARDSHFAKLARNQEPLTMRDLVDGGDVFLENYGASWAKLQHEFANRRALIIHPALTPLQPCERCGRIPSVESIEVGRKNRLVGFVVQCAPPASSHWAMETGQTIEEAVSNWNRLVAHRARRGVRKSNAGRTA